MSYKEVRAQELQKNELLHKMVELEEKKKKETELQDQKREKSKEREKILSQLSEHKDKLFKRREEMITKINSQLAPEIRVNIVQFGNTELYGKALSEALKGSEIRYSSIVEKLVEYPPSDVVRWVQEENSEALSDNLKITKEQAEKIIRRLKNTVELYDLEIVDLPDKPMIQLKDGEEYKESTDLSTGQKCTTILSLLLLESHCPLIIDQPEDNLDNAFIYETVVKKLREIKKNRQIIFVTHNPNIPVLGEAERVFVLTSDGKKARLEISGTVEQTKDSIVDLLEGGKEAFERRKQEYGY